MNACAKPSGEGCSAYSNFTPNWLPSPSNRLKPGKSNGVEIIRISRIPANINTDERTALPSSSRNIPEAFCYARSTTGR